MSNVSVAPSLRTTSAVFSTFSSSLLHDVSVVRPLNIRIEASIHLFICFIFILNSCHIISFPTCKGTNKNRLNKSQPEAFVITPRITSEGVDHLAPRSQKPVFAITKNENTLYKPFLQSIFRLLKEIKACYELEVILTAAFVGIPLAKLHSEIGKCKLFAKNLLFRFFGVLSQKTKLNF